MFGPERHPGNQSNYDKARKGLLSFKEIKIDDERNI